MRKFRNAALARDTSALVQRFIDRSHKHLVFDDACFPITLPLYYPVCGQMVSETSVQTEFLNLISIEINETTRQMKGKIVLSRHSKTVSRSLVPLL